MAQVPDLVSLLGLDPRQSRSSFGGQHRSILISKDFNNTGDFVFNNLIQYFSRKEPKTPLLLVTLSQDWTNYSSIAAKCGSNLRRSENMGSIEVLNIMNKFFDSYKKDHQNFDICSYLNDSVHEFINKHTPNEPSTGTKPIIIMIDDLSILTAIGCKSEDVYRLSSSLDKNLRKRSAALNTNQSSFFVMQSTVTCMRDNETSWNQQKHSQNNNLDYVIANIGNQCDIVIALKPLDTGYSTRVDGTIKIIDNRLPATKPSPAVPTNPDTMLSLSSMLNLDAKAQIGLTRSYFYKLSDRRARLTSSALIM